MSNVKRVVQECWSVDNVKFASGQRSSCQKSRLLKPAIITINKTLLVRFESEYILKYAFYELSFKKLWNSLRYSNIYQRSRIELRENYSSNLSLIKLSILYPCSCLCATFYKELNKHCWLIMIISNFYVLTKEYHLGFYCTFMEGYILSNVPV